MRTTRRATLVAAVGLATLSGCGILQGSGTGERNDDPDQSAGTGTSPSTEPETGDTATETTSTPEETPSDGSDVTTGVTLDHAVDVLVYEHDGAFRAVSNDEIIASHPDDLGRVINDAQSELSEGYILVATDGSSSTEISHGDDITIGSIDRRTKLVPAEDTDGSFKMYLASNGLDDGRFESVCVDMENRSGPAVQSGGFTDVDFDDLLVRNTGGYEGHGLALVGGRQADVRDCRFTGISGDALRVADSSDVSVRNWSRSVRSTGSTPATRRDSSFTAFGRGSPSSTASRCTTTPKTGK